MQWLVDNYPDHLEDRDNVRIHLFKLMTTNSQKSPTNINHLIARYNFFL